MYSLNADIKERMINLYALIERTKSENDEKQKEMFFVNMNKFEYDLNLGTKINWVKEPIQKHNEYTGVVVLLTSDIDRVKDASEILYPETITTKIPYKCRVPIDRDDD